MSDQKEYTNGHGREPNKKPDIGRDDVEDLIDFGVDSDDEEEIDEESEELPVSDGMQVVLEASQLLPQDDNSDEIEEVPGDLPEVLYEFDPENQGVAENQGEAESLEEEVVVEQQVLDVAGVLIEMVEERSENELLVEGQVQIEVACDEAEQETPQSLMGLENPSNQCLEDPTSSSEPSSADSVNERRLPFASDSSAIDQDANTEDHGPNDQCLDGESSRQGSNNQDGNNGPSSLGQGVNVQDPSDEPSRSDQGLNEPSEFGQGPSNQVQNGRPSTSYQGMNNEAQNCEPSISSRGAAVDQNFNGRSVISVQGLKEGPSGSGQGLGEQDAGVKLRSDQVALVQNLNEQSRLPQEYNPKSSCIARVSNNEILNGGPSRSDKDPIEQQILEDAGACGEVMEQLELEEDEVVVDVQAHPIQDVEMERQPSPEQGIGLRDQIMEADVVEQDIGLRDQIVAVADVVEHGVDLNGGPHSSPDPGEQRERVGQVAANEEVVAPFEAVVLGRPPDHHVEEAPDQNEDVLLDEQDNLVEEQAEGVQILPGPLEREIGGQENDAAEEPDMASEVQKTK